MKQFIFLTLILTTLSFTHARHSHEHSQAPSPSPSSPSPLAPSPSTVDCSTIIYDMADCITFLSLGSEEKEPSKSCCGGFKTVLDYDPICICEAIISSQQLGILLDNKKAEELPSACGISAPSLSCAASLTPGASPVNPPTSPPSPPANQQPSSPQTPAPATKPVVMAPSPSQKGGSGDLSVSLILSLVVMIVSSFAFASA